jgi:hypothetical protein
MSNVNSLLHSVPKLTGASDYPDWEFAIGMVFRRAGDYEVVMGLLKETAENSKEWRLKAEDALAIIGLTIAPSQYGHIRDATNGPEAWSALAAIYKKNSRATRISLKRQIYGYQHNPNAPMQEYISAVTSLAARLSALGKDNTLTPTAVTDILIFNLHESYSNIAATLTATKDELTVADVTSALLDEEGRRAGFTEHNSATDSFHPSSLIEVASAARVADKGVTCFNCGRTGHISRNCRSPKKDRDTETAGFVDDDYDAWF